MQFHISLFSKYCSIKKLVPKSAGQEFWNLKDSVSGNKSVFTNGWLAADAFHIFRRNEPSKHLRQRAGGMVHPNSK